MSRRYLYNYCTLVNFGQPVVNHAVMLRCQPAQCSYIDIEEEHLVMSSGYRMRYGRDAFDNRLAYGNRRDAHTSMAYVSTGIVSMTEYKVAADAMPLMLWRLPSRLTCCADVPVVPGSSFDMPAPEAATHRDPAFTADFGLAVGIAHEVHAMMEYAPGATDVSTTAADAMVLRRGVCQDYAHVMIALCRRAGLAARYVCGFLCGTGQTHAWVEVFDGYSWRGIDPTNDVCIDYGYIKLAHGRDASYCPVNRGMFGGDARHTMLTDVKVTEI